MVATMDTCVSDWAVLQDLRTGRLSAGRSLHRSRRASTRSTRSDGDALRSEKAQTNQRVPSPEDNVATLDFATSGAASPESDRLSLSDLGGLSGLSEDSLSPGLHRAKGSVPASRSVPDLATHDISNLGIHLPTPQFELNGDVSLTPHVTLSRPNTPGPAAAAAAAAAILLGTTPSRQPSLHRHRASAVLEELRSQPDSAGSAANSAATGTLSSAVNTSWSSVPVPYTASRRWRIRPQLLAVGSVCLMMVSTGFMMTYQSPANPQHVLTSNERRQNHLLAVGCLLGSLVGGAALFAGRRRPLMLACLLDSLVWTLPIFGAGSWLAYTAEILTGLLVCAAILVALVYVAEVSVAECRGGFLVAALASFDCGVLLCLLLAELLSARHLAVVGLCLLPAVFAALLLVLPESPRYIAAAGNRVAAEISLRQLRGLDFYSETELNLVLTNADCGATAAPAAAAAWLRAYTSRPTLRALLVSAGLTLLVPFCGFSTVASFTVGLFTEQGPRVQRTALACATLIKIASTLCAALLVDRFGRRVPLLLASALQAAALTALALSALLMSAELVYSAGGMAALLLLAGLYIAGAGLGISTLPWVLAAELFPQRGRAAGLALTALTYWSGDLVSAWLVLLVQDSLGASGVLWMHFLFTTAAYIFTFFLVPESTDRALEEIEVYFNEKTSKKIKSRVPSVLITRL